MILTLTFALFLLAVFASFILTCLPIRVSTEGGRADQRGVHIEHFSFVLDDSHLRAEDAVETTGGSSETGDDSAPLYLPHTSESLAESFKEAA